MNFPTSTVNVLPHLQELRDTWREQDFRYTKEQQEQFDMLLQARRERVKWFYETNRVQIGPKIVKKEEDKREGFKPPAAKPGKKKKKGVNTRWVSRTRRIGTQDNTIEVKLSTSDSDEDNRTSGSSSSDDVGDTSKPGREVKDKGARVRMLRMSRSVGMMVNKLSNQPYAVIDPGAEEDILWRYWMVCCAFLRQIKAVTNAFI